MKDQARVRVHIAIAEVLARLRVIDGPRRSGSDARVQLRLESPAVGRAGDRRSCAPIRSRSRSGAVVIDPWPESGARSVSSIPRAAEAAVAAVRMVEEAGTAA